jgi:hypothetical protein
LTHPNAQTLLAQVIDAFGALAAAQVIGTANDDERKRRRQSHGNHVRGDDLAQADAGIKSFGAISIKCSFAASSTSTSGYAWTEGCNQRLQHDRHYRGRHREAQQSGWSLPEVTRHRACCDELLERGFCTRQKAFAGFRQANAARRADEQRRAERASSARTAWLIADGVTPSSAEARRKLRCCATLRNASTPSSAPCLTVKFCFIAHQHYSE